jgi:hypothetical protein
MIYRGYGFHPVAFFALAPHFACPKSHMIPQPAATADNYVVKNRKLRYQVVP